MRSYPLRPFLLPRSDTVITSHRNRLSLFSLYCLPAVSLFFDFLQHRSLFPTHQIHSFATRSHQHTLFHASLPQPDNTLPSTDNPQSSSLRYLSIVNITPTMFANSLTALTAVLPLLSLASASHATPQHHRRHHALANRDQPSPRGIAQVAPRANAGHAEAQRTIKRAVKKRGAKQQCRARGSSPPTSESAIASSAAPSSAAPSPSVVAVSSVAAAAESAAIPNQGAWADHVRRFPVMPNHRSKLI